LASTVLDAGSVVFDVSLQAAIAAAKLRAGRG
jgi:hypothetical protein